MESLETLERSTTELVDRAYKYGMIQVREEITEFVDFLRERGPLGNVLEIGSESGGTFYLWCRLASLSAHKISIDKPDGASGSWRYVDPAALKERNETFLNFASRVSIINADSHDGKTVAQVADILAGDKLDLLFIDGDHSFAGVKADYEMYKSLVSADGMIVFHDIQHLGPKIFWEELHRRGGKLREFNQNLHWAGLGVLTAS
jgi:cephalosporin hydroxylase